VQVSTLMKLSEGRARLRERLATLDKDQSHAISAPTLSDMFISNSALAVGDTMNVSFKIPPTYCTIYEEMQIVYQA
jgi:hypothetical protein